MPVTKTTTVISNNITLTAGSGTTTSTVYSATVGWHKMVHLKLTNGVTPPATPASAIIEASADNSNWYTFSTGYIGPAGTNGVSSWTVLVWSAVQYVRVTWTAGDTQNVTARAEICDATEIAESATGTSNSSNAVADSSNTALRTNLYNEVASSFVSQTQVTISTSAVQLASNTCIKGVIIKALNGNTGTIYVGNSSGVTSSNGLELGAGESISLPLNNSNLIWVIASVANQIICYGAI